MRGEFVGVWSEAWREIWQPLTELPLSSGDPVPAEVFQDLYRELAGEVRRPGALLLPPPLGVLAEILQSPVRSREALIKIGAEDIASEGELTSFFEAAFEVLEELGGDELSNRYFNLLDAFIEKYSLRYELRRPCAVCPTVPGMFSSLHRALHRLGDNDQNVAHRLRDYRESVHDLRLGLSESRIATCVSKQVMLLEAIGASSGLRGRDLGAFCRSLPDSPHPAVGKALGNLYGFASDFPGLRHGTPSGGMTRAVGMKDLLAASILLSGFAPYLESRLNASEIYGGATRRRSLGTASVDRTARLGNFLEIASRIARRLLSSFQGRSRNLPP
ncbi:MAG: hypothetical protein AB7N73_10025 [Gemmatimonadales bacterium]